MKKIYFKIYIFLLIIFNIHNIYGNIYVSELNFKDNEFIEIYSDEILNISNISNIFLYDDAGINKSNLFYELNLKENSKYIILSSEKFIENYEFLSLNCSVYTNKKSEIGYYGLKNDAEDIYISFDYLGLNLTFNFTKEKDFNFNINQSLNYDFKNNSYYISNLSPCESFFDFNSVINLGIDNNISFLIFENETISNKNQSNFTQIDLNQSVLLLNNSYGDNLLNFQNYSFEIITTKDIFTDKIKYKFKTNATDFIIEYYIEDFGGNILKEKRNTSLIGEKSLSLDYSEIVVIKANLYVNNIYVSNISKIVYFYSINKQNGVNLEKMLTKNLDNSSYIKIINKKEIENLSQNYLEYEVYRGNDSKRTVSIYHNGDKLSSFELEKYSKIYGKIDFDKIYGNNSLVIFGFDIKSEIFFYPTEDNNSNYSSFLVEDNLKEHFKVVNFSLNSLNLVKFDIDSNINYSFSCYINYERTLVSEVLNFTKEENNNLTQNLILNIDNLKILEKLEKKQEKLLFLNNDLIDNEIEIELKFYCKYKKLENKNFKYFSFVFNYSIYGLNESESALNSTYLFSNNIENILKNESLEKENSKNKLETTLNYTNQSAVEKLNLLSNLNKNSLNSLSTNSNYLINSDMENSNIRDNSKYISKNFQMKENSFFPLFAGIVVLFVSFIIFW